GVYAMARAIARRGSDFRSRESSVTDPSSAFHNPPSNRSSVLLPDPFGPTSASKPPPRNSSDAWRRSQRPSMLIPALSSSSLINRRRGTVSVRAPVPYCSLTAIASASQQQEQKERSAASGGDNPQSNLLGPDYRSGQQVRRQKKYRAE